MTALHVSIRMRPLADLDADFAAMMAVLRACPSNEFHYYPSPGDIKVWLGEAEALRNFQLWETAEGRVVAWATMHYPYCNLHFHVHPHARSADFAIEAQIVAWGEQRMREYNAEKGETNTLDACARADCSERLDILNHFGFASVNDFTWRYRRSLLEPIPQPVFPQGFTIRHVAGDHEAEAYALLNQHAFKREKADVEGKLKIMHKPKYIADLDLIAVAPNGDWAAFCTCDFDPLDNATLEEKVGWTDPIGVHENYRGLGLARNLILLGFHKLRDLGMETSLLGTGSDNTRAHYVYESVGYQKFCVVNWYAKPLQAS